MPALLAGKTVWLGPDAGIQFRIRPIWFQVVAVVEDWPSYWAGAVWIDGYQLDQSGNRVERRKIYVIEQGVREATVTRSARAQMIAAQGGRQLA